MTHCMPGSFLKVPDFSLGVSQNLFLQAAELVASTAHKLSGLLLEFADEGSDCPVDLICIHECLSLKK